MSTSRSASEASVAVEPLSSHPPLLSSITPPRRPPLAHQGTAGTTTASPRARHGDGVIMKTGGGGTGGATVAPVCDVAHILSSIRRVRGPLNLRDETSPATIASEKAALQREAAATSQLLLTSSSGGGGSMVDGTEEELTTAGSPWWVRPPSASQSALLHYSHLRKHPKKQPPTSTIITTITTPDGDGGGAVQSGGAAVEMSSFISSGPTSPTMQSPTPPTATSPQQQRTPRIPTTSHSSPPGSPKSPGSPSHSVRSGGVTSASGRSNQLVVVPPVHTPNWRALLYTDVYKSDDEQKETLTKKYEALLGAQKKLFPQFGGPPARAGGGNDGGGAPSNQTPSNTTPRKYPNHNNNNKSSSGGKKKGGGGGAARARGGAELRSPGKYLRETGKATAPDKLATTAQIQSARNTMLNARAYFCGRTARSRENAAAAAAVAGGGGGSQPTQNSPRSGPILAGVVPPKSPDDVGTLGGNGAVVPFGKHVLPLLAGRSASTATTASGTNHHQQQRHR